MIRRFVDQGKEFSRREEESVYGGVRPLIQQRGPPWRNVTGRTWDWDRRAGLASPCEQPLWALVCLFFCLTVCWMGVGEIRI